MFSLAPRAAVPRSRDSEQRWFNRHPCLSALVPPSRVCSYCLGRSYSRHLELRSVLPSRRLSKLTNFPCRRLTNMSVWLIDANKHEW